MDTEVATSDYTPTKTCSICGETYPATPEFFHRKRKSLYGVSQKCKRCACAITAKWRKENADRVVEWRETHPDYQKTWYQEHREEHLARTKARYDADPEKKQKSNREWRNKNPERARLLMRGHHARRKARMLGNGGTHSVSDIELQFRSQKGKCWWCGKKLKGKYEVDHRIPLSRGGTNAANNLCITCVECNRKKRAKLPHEWIGRLL